MHIFSSACQNVLNWSLGPYDWDLMTDNARLVFGQMLGHCRVLQEVSGCYITSQLKRVWQKRERRKRFLANLSWQTFFSHINKVILIMISVFLSIYWTSLIFQFLLSLCRIFDDSGLNHLPLFLKLCPMQTWITFSQCDQFSQSAYSSPQSPH